MSVFKVALNNVEQGLLDKDPSTATPGAITGQGLGDQIDPSKQRQVYIMGPNLINRLMIDGETFTDCNYWKQFAYPQVSLEDAIVEVLVDDGSVYSSNPELNTYPAATTITAVGGTTFADNELDIVSTYGGPAVFTQITNNGAGDVQVRLNGLTTATFTLASGDTQIFNNGDLTVTKIQVDNSASGAADADVAVLLSVQSICTS
ncbi:MAG: hypothetical protein ACYSWP_15740 [Planctomycetota bacterium]